MWTHLLLHASPPVRPVLLKLYRCFAYGLRICMCFLRKPEIISFHFFYTFNLDIFRSSILWECIGGRYLESATPTVFGRSLSSSLSHFWFTCRYRGNIHISELPSSWLTARMADLTPDLQVCLSWGSIAESFHSLQSLSVSCFHVILGLPGPCFPSTCMS